MDWLNATCNSKWIIILQWASNCAILLHFIRITDHCNLFLNSSYTAIATEMIYNWYLGSRNSIRCHQTRARSTSFPSIFVLGCLNTMPISNSLRGRTKLEPKRQTEVDPILQWGQMNPYKEHMIKRIHGIKPGMKWNFRNLIGRVYMWFSLSMKNRHIDKHANHLFLK